MPLQNCPICKNHDFTYPINLQFFKMCICENCKNTLMPLLPANQLVADKLRSAQVTLAWEKDYVDIPHMVRNSRQRRESLLHEVYTIIYKK